MKLLNQLTPSESMQRSAVTILQTMASEPVFILEDALPGLVSLFSDDKMAALQARLLSKSSSADPSRVTSDYTINHDWCGNPVPTVHISEDGIATVPLIGYIIKGAGNLGRFLGMADLDAFRENMTSVMGNPDVRMIILVVNSPGGQNIGVLEAAKLVVKASQSKPLMTYTDTIMGSSAYWIGGAAPYVYCSASSIIGGIGSYMVLDDIMGMLEQLGIKRMVIRSGEYKGIGEDEVTKKQIEYFTQKINHAAGQFKSFISSRRTLISPSNMEGQAFFGDEGVAAGFAAGLADSLPEAVVKFTKQLR